jgi:hypothetical protein
MLLVKFNKQIIGDFLFPSFRVKSGDIVIIQFPSGPYFYPHMMKMADIFKGKVPKDGVEILSPFKYPEHMWKTSFRHRFFPLTVGAYLKKNANKESPFFTKIYEESYITSKTKIGTIPGSPRRKLAVYATLSWTNLIVFDLAGVDPMGGEDIYNTVKQAIGTDGAAILIDSYDEFKNNCNVFVRPQYVGDTILNKKRD